LAEKTLHAKRYSQAIFEIAKERNAFDKWQENLQKIGALAQNLEFVSVMENPQFPAEEKYKLLDVQLKNIEPLALNLAYMLTSKGVFGLITDIYADYQKILDNYRGIDKAEVTTAIPLDEKEKQQLAERLGAITGKKIILTMHIDPNIIGGVIARVGEKIIDGSTRSQLMALKNELESSGS
jgi:F-type H+-transporting ATPase subunit delta